MPEDRRQPITRDECHAFLDQTTFRLRPPDYGTKYPKWPGAVGLEIEMLPVVPPESGNEAPGIVMLQGGKGTTADILRRLAMEFDWQVEETLADGTAETHLLLRLLLDRDDNISFEPGGQVEFSSKPYPCLSDAVKRMRKVQKRLDRAYDKAGYNLVQVGINPWHTVDEIGLQMNKSRYRAMDAYYRTISEFGPRMMRQTCTVQVNLDFGPDESTLARRYVAGQLLAPIATATFAFSPMVDGALTGVSSYRSRVWRYTDPTHTGIPGLEQVMELTTRDQCVQTYLDFVLTANVVFIEALGYRNPPKKMSFGQWMQTPIDGVLPTLEDFKTHLSLMFPEVRPRGFLELRSIDCQARPFQIVPACYYTGLLYDDDSLERLINLLNPHRHHMHGLLARAERGLHDDELRSLASAVMDIAVDGFERLPSCFKTSGSDRAIQVFREHFTARGKTPADELVDMVERRGGNGLGYQELLNLNEYWSSLLQ